jgi:hypothetical protein
MRILILIIGMSLLLSCNQKSKEYAPVGISDSQHEVVIKEVLQAGGYTYLLVEEANNEYWMAVSQTEAKEGDKIYYETAMEMTDFESKELDKVFDKILFVDFASAEPITKKSQKEEAIERTKVQMTKMLDSIKISPVEGGISIADLYRGSKEYNGKQVIVSGQVIKVNMDIMDRNWVHLMDGTKGGDRSDLTFTTMETVKIGDTVTFVGTLALDKEFGAGYVYPLIVEGAVLK